ncbi:hypothetical protein [Lederbergia panacisoli]|nr:hypothetical protein [Lederbergia panacisoli]MCR2821426.1 hypothetical protein [Lederbergia panacisoli]
MFEMIFNLFKNTVSNSEETQKIKKKKEKRKEEKEYPYKDEPEDRHYFY